MSRSLNLLLCLSIALLSRAALAQSTRPTTVPTAKTALNAPTTAAQSLYDRITPALVVVQFTYEGELGRRELHGVGTVVSNDGLVMFSMGLTPNQVPDEQMKDFKILIPGDDETELDAQFQGRDERTNLAFLKVSESRDWKPITYEDVPVHVGEPLTSIGILPKDAGYKTYMTFPRVAANLRGPVPQVLVTADGLSGVGSPVFNERRQVVGFVHQQANQTPLLDTDPREPFPFVMDPPRFFTPARDFLLSLSDPPLAGEPIKMPSVGVSNLSGLKKEVADYFGLKDPAVQVGDVIANFPADKAGMQDGDVIVKMDGQPLERGDEPDETPQIMTRKIARMKVGETVTFTVLRGGRDAPLKDITVTLQERPKPVSKAKRFWAEDLGFSTRELVFDDTYSRRLPADTKGVVVALVKPGSAAQAQDRLRGGDLILQLNQTPVESLDQFKEQYQQFRKTNPSDAVVLEVLRGVNTQVVRIEPPQ
jgi:serine protease Do